MKYLLITGNVMKDFMVFYTCAYCGKKSGVEIKERSNLVKCKNPDCGKLSVADALPEVKEYKKVFIEEMKKRKKESNYKFLGLVLFMTLIPILSSILI